MLRKWLIRWVENTLDFLFVDQWNKEIFIFPQNPMELPYYSNLRYRPTYGHYATRCRDCGAYLKVSKEEYRQGILGELNQVETNGHVIYFIYNGVQVKAA